MPGQERGKSGQLITNFRLVAASDTPETEKLAASWLCLGSNDGLVINAALAEISSIGSKLLLAPGTYVLGSAGITLPADCQLLGSGLATIISGSSTYLVTMGRRSKLSGVQLASGTYNHIRVPEDAILAHLSDIYSKNPGLAHIYTNGELRRGCLINQQQVKDFRYERPEDEPQDEYDLIPSGKGIFDGDQALVDVFGRNLDEFLNQPAFS